MSTAPGVLDRYLCDVREKGFVDDPAQRAVAAALDTVLESLARRQGSGWLRRWRRPQPVRGLYIYGGVGRGKTYLMDIFFELVPEGGKLRQHFHRFMRRVHDELKIEKGRQDPLETVAERIAAQTPLICFDEFFVSDIADAMLLGNLFTALFERGATLVATSNVHPDDLYKDGLQRRRFLPAIRQLKMHTDIIKADGDTDYRLILLEREGTYHTPLDDGADERLRNEFDRIAPRPGSGPGKIDIANRAIPFVRRSEGTIWFTFDALCRGPRGVDDYIEIARCFASVVVSDVPVLDAGHEDEARRFIALVDEFYDRRVKLIVSAAAPIAGLYVGRRLEFEFQRTASRLEEMQGRAYLASAHRP